jgi:putative membrane protein
MDSRQEDAEGQRSSRVDYRYLLANERTYLAYVRTGLSLQVAGLGVLQFLTHVHTVVRYGLGVALVAAGSYVAFFGHSRMRSNERAIRAGEDIRASAANVVVVAVVVAVPLAGALVMTFR